MKCQFLVNKKKCHGRCRALTAFAVLTEYNAVVQRTEWGVLWYIDRIHTLHISWM